MKRFFTFAFLFSLAVNLVYSQTIQQYRKDLSALHSLLKKTPSYRDQMKGAHLEKYNSLYEGLMNDTVDLSSYHYFNKLASLMVPIQDGHLGLAQVPNYEHFKDRVSIENYTLTNEFKDFTKYHINIDSLKTELAKKSAESVEGIYYYDKYYSVGIFKIAPKEYLGIIVDKHEDMNLWDKGQIALKLYEYQPNYFKAIYVHPLTKNFILYNNERYEHQSLVNSHFYLSYSEAIYRKSISEYDYTQLPKGTPMFQLKNLNEHIQYLLIRNFSANPITAKQSNAFYDSIHNNLRASALILDLRNNEGGANKISRKFMRLIKKYAAKNKVYVLVNNATISHGEIFTLRLSELRNVKILGRTTKGVISYGSNYGNWVKLPSKQFEVYLTDMKDTNKFLLRYENIGVRPDIELNNNMDWVEQTLQIIKKEF